jgi:hypothetical protein
MSNAIEHISDTALAVASKTFMKDGAPFAIQRAAKNGWTPDANTPRPSPDDPAGIWLFQGDA